MVRRLACLVLVAVVSLVFARQARADGGRVPIGVLSIESDDAEEHAEALTVALRSRLRAGTSFQVVEVGQSLGMLTAALRCGKTPDLACQAKIADQLKVDRVIWGTMQKSPGKEVSADIHLFHRGRGEERVRESYTDNMKDGADDALRKVAQRILDRLMQKSPGFAVIKGNATEVVIDGTRRSTIDRGTLRIDLAPGSHSLEFTAKGLRSQKRDVTIAPGVEVTVAITLSAPNAPPTKPTEPDTGPSPMRKIVGYTVMGVGAAGVVTGGIFGASFFIHSSKQNDLNAKFPSTGGDACEYAANNDSGIGASKGNAKEACDNSKAGEKAGNLAWVFGGVGAAVLGVGAYIVLTAPDDKEKPKRASSVRVTPAVGTRSGGVLVLGEF